MSASATHTYPLLSLQRTTAAQLVATSCTAVIVGTYLAVAFCAVAGQLSCVQPLALFMVNLLVPMAGLAHFAAQRPKADIR